MNWHVKKMSELTPKQLYAIMRVRVDVFVVEQKCPYPELDGYDEEALHLFLKSKEQIIAYARLLPSGSRYGVASIGRVLVTKPFRREGYGKQLMEKAIFYIQSNWEETHIQIQAQTYLQHFYESLGFRSITSPYLEDHIPHIDMVMTL